MNRPPHSSQSLADAAGDWFLRRQAGLTVAEEAELSAWLAADPAHERAFENFERTWRALHEPRHRGFADTALASLARRKAQRTRRRRRVALLGGAAAVVLFFLAIARSPEQRATEAAGESVVVRADQRTLPDGSLVELNAGAHVETLFSATERRVRLVQGEALFTVQKDAARPFIVAAGDLTVRAVGTAFSVRRGAATVDVLVTEGVVAVARTDAPVGSGDRLVGSGEQVQVPAAPEKPWIARRVEPAHIAQALAWRSQRISFADTPLRQVLSLFNRHNTLQLDTADSATGELAVTGVFWTNDVETFVRLVETGLNLESQRQGDRILLRRR